jgi:hypothetical protein
MSRRLWADVGQGVLLVAAFALLSRDVDRTLRQPPVPAAQTRAFVERLPRAPRD